MVVFNVVFIVINAVYSYFLLIKLVKVKLTPIEERIFERDFKKVMDRTTFRDFIRKAHLRTFSEGAQIVHLNNTFTGLYYIALLNPNYTVDYYKEGEKYFSVGENSWIGVVEYSMYEKERKKRDMQISKDNDTKMSKAVANKKKRIKIKWGLSGVVSSIPDTSVINQESLKVLEPIYDQEDEPCYVYEFPLSVLEKMFSIKDEGILFKNALYSIWLTYTTKAIEKVDEEVVVHKKSFKQRQTTVKSNTNVLRNPLDTQDKPLELGGISNTYNNDDEFFDNDQNRYETGARFIPTKNMGQHDEK